MHSHELGMLPTGLKRMPKGVTITPPTEIPQ